MENGTAHSQGVVFSSFFFLTVLWFKAFKDNVAMQARCVLVTFSLVPASIQVCGSHPSAVCCASQAFRSTKNPQCGWIRLLGVFTLNFALCDHSMAGFRAAVPGGSQPRSALRTELVTVSWSVAH